MKRMKEPKRWTLEEAKKRRMLDCPFFSSIAAKTAEELEEHLHRSVALPFSRTSLTAKHLAEFIISAYRPRKNEWLRVHISYGYDDTEWKIEVWKHKDKKEATK